MPASVTVEGGGSGWGLGCFLNHLLSLSTILVFWESTLCLLYPIPGWPPYYMVAKRATILYGGQPGHHVALRQRQELVLAEVSWV